MKQYGPATLDEILAQIETFLNDDMDFIPMECVAIEEDTSYSNDQYSLCSDDWYCWRTEEACMAALSAAFPGTLFALEATGEVPEATHRTYAKNGIWQIVDPIITWPEPKFGG